MQKRGFLATVMAMVSGNNFMDGDGSYKIGGGENHNSLHQSKGQRKRRKNKRRISSKMRSINR